ncbi:MAG TPA: lipopolysaccharide kinase InaA family protein [Methylophilaceae bacterium]|nr:lipopolysaccharide kinase InaA family protein [Methylophilaceae bacterium]
MAKPTLLDGKLLWAGLRYLLTGRLALRGGYLPPPGHEVPRDFAGVGVATAEDPAVDACVLGCLQGLGVRQVRLDMTYGDLDNHVARLLETLIDDGMQVLLHLVQPYEAARNMGKGLAREEWRAFVAAVLERFGARVAAVEVGSTVNRRRWAGYDTAGFFAMWDIARQESWRSGVKLAGPNVTDFEPLYNVAILSRMRDLGQLPDIHTDNLFSERVTEPERFDHRILGFRAAVRLKVNLVKKARLLKKITGEFGVAELTSPAAFWTLPRIQRILPDGEQKQADYLARYFILCAASGALRQAYWGPLICAREGLVDDGTATYPALERITHYREASGNFADYRRRPAFSALKTFSSLIPGTRYEGALSTANGLEVHAFRSAERLIHAVWTANGRALPLDDAYRREDLGAAHCISRDGETLDELPEFASEAPVYLTWPATAEVGLAAVPHAGRFVSIHRHVSQKTHYALDLPGWRGAVLASDPKQAALLRQQLAPGTLPAPAADTLLRKARNVIWRIPDPRGPAQKLVAKKPLKMHPHKRLLDRFKPSKALRSWNAAGELLRRGINTPAPVAWLERVGDRTLTENIYVCEFFAADFSVRELFDAFARGEREFMGIPQDDAYRQLSRFLLELHGKGVYFRDLSGGNILIRKGVDNALEFALIDINRAHFFNHATALGKRIADLTRVCNKLHWAGREALVGMYLQSLNRRFGWRQRLPFYLYDFKVSFKRNFGRKAIKRLLK